jgi:hypothetical protein
MWCVVVERPRDSGKSSFNTYGPFQREYQACQFADRFTHKWREIPGLVAHCVMMNEPSGEIPDEMTMGSLGICGCRHSTTQARWMEEAAGQAG